MGSGLILLLIVGAWLAVLVPMALRSDEVRTSAAAERLHDARRVLSRRTGSRPAATAVDGPVTSRRVAADPVDRPHRSRTGTDTGTGLRALARRWPVGPTTVPVADSAPTRLLARRRRLQVVGVLAVLALATLVGALVGPGWLLPVHLALDLLLIGFLVSIRLTAVQRDERSWRQQGEHERTGARRARTNALADPERTATAGAAVPAAAVDDTRATSRSGRPARRLTDQQQAERAAVQAEARAERARLAFARTAAERTRRPVPVSHVAGIPNRMPARPGDLELVERRPDVVPEVAVDRVAAPAGADRPARGAQGEPWQPVSVPVPTYVTAPQALRPPAPAPVASRRVADPVPGPAADHDDDGAQELADAVPVRRASGDW